jgi:bifunctional ADP-heptose synthase (sugar kinase/adenylyltransferase)
MNIYENTIDKITPQSPGNGGKVSGRDLPSMDDPFAWPEELRDFLKNIKSHYTLADFMKYLDGIGSLSVLVVGETIIDEYCYCETIGKSGKEPILAARYISSEKFAGGVLAIANHVANFCGDVGVLSFLGAADSGQELIDSKLNPRIKKHFLYIENEPTLTKKRYVEIYPLQKLFEVYIMNNCSEPPSCGQGLCEALEQLLPQYDVVIVADYGHGMIDSHAVDILCKRSGFLAVNTQVNAENRGFNTISKYHRADYICISESEIRLEARSRTKEIQNIISDVSKKLSCPNLLITQGQAGCLNYRKESGFCKSPAFIQHYIDRIGAGDAVLGITSPLVHKNMPPEMLGFVGNIIGALAVGVMGNKEPVRKDHLIKYLEHLLEIQA